jgi:hypothetical protein
MKNLFVKGSLELLDLHKGALNSNNQALRGKTPSQNSPQ